MKERLVGAVLWLLRVWRVLWNVLWVAPGVLGGVVAGMVRGWRVAMETRSVAVWASRGSIWRLCALATAVCWRSGSESLRAAWNAKMLIGKGSKTRIGWRVGQHVGEISASSSWSCTSLVD